MTNYKQQMPMKNNIQKNNRRVRRGSKPKLSIPIVSRTRPAFGGFKDLGEKTRY
jgi:hypothetical protein